MLTVGRKWATLDNQCRIDLDNLYADGRGYVSPGRAYLSRETYEAERRRDEAWTEFRRRIRDGYGVPVHATLDAIEQATKLLWPSDT